MTSFELSLTRVGERKLSAVPSPIAPGRRGLVRAGVAEARHQGGCVYFVVVAARDRRLGPPAAVAPQPAHARAGRPSSSSARSPRWRSSSSCARRETSRYHTTIVFLIPAAMLLPPELVALMGLIQHIPEWLKNRSAWYIQIFNICNWTLSILAAYAAFHAVLGLNPGATCSTRSRASRAAASMVVVNHVLMAPMLHLARGHSIRESGLFSFPSLSTDLVLAMLGVAMASFWMHQPVADPVRRRTAAADPPLAERPAAPGGGARRPEDGPLQRTPLRGRAERGAGRGPSASTGRSRSSWPTSTSCATSTTRTATSRATPSCRGSPKSSAPQLRHYDVPARFGGEEFAILLPETPPEQAFEIAERIRRTVAASAFDVETSSEPIRATISIGVAGFPRDGADSNELIHQADLAVYRAKLQGRNRVLDASSEPLLLPEKRQGTPRRGAGGRGPPRTAPAGGRIRADAGTAPSSPARHARTAFPVALEAARRVRRAWSASSV